MKKLNSAILYSIFIFQSSYICPLGSRAKYDPNLRYCNPRNCMEYRPVPNYNYKPKKQATFIEQPSQEIMNEFEAINASFPPTEFNFNQVVAHFLEFWISFGQIKIMSHFKQNYDEPIKKLEELLGSEVLNLYEKDGDEVFVKTLPCQGNLNNYLNTIFKKKTKEYLHSLGISLEGEAIASNPIRTEFKKSHNSAFRPLT